MARQRTGSAIWKGGLKDGNGVLSTGSGAVSELPYSFKTRFEDERAGTNPEELIASAHAACFSMALAAVLEERGIIPSSVRTRADLDWEKLAIGWTVTAVHLRTTIDAPGAERNADAIFNAAEEAKANCPVSRLLNTRIDVDAAIEGVPDARRIA